MNKHMKIKKVGIIIIVLVILIGGAIFIKKGRNVETLNNPKQTASQQGNVANVNSAIDSDKDGVPDVAEITLGTDPNNSDTDGDGISDLQDKNPVFAENPIKNKATTEGFKITDAIVENNLDEITKKIANDHLEITLQNVSCQDLSNFEIYYTILDSNLNKTEGYYKKLNGFTLKNNEKKAIHFDNINGFGHFGENPNSIYRTNGDAKVFDVILSTPGFKIESIQIKKDVGGAEKAD